MHEQMDNIIKGHIRVYEQANPKNIIFEEDNVICSNTKYLFARMMAASGDSPVWPGFGVWGLAVGAGGPDWPINTQPDALNTQQSILTPILRKRLSSVNYVDSSLNIIVDSGYSNIVDFQTVLNATSDNIGTPIREIGLIAGGDIGTDMMAAPFFDSTNQTTINTIDSVVLVNYKTLPPLKLPEGISFVWSWVLTF